MIQFTHFLSHALGLYIKDSPQRELHLRSVRNCGLLKREAAHGISSQSARGASGAADTCTGRASPKRLSRPLLKPFEVAFVS